MLVQEVGDALRDVVKELQDAHRGGHQRQRRASCRGAPQPLLSHRAPGERGLALLVGTQALSPAPCHSPADSSPRDRATPGRRGWSLAQLHSVSLALPAGPSGVRSQALGRGTSLAITTISDSSIEYSLLPPSVRATPALGLRGPAATPFTKACPQTWALQSALLIDQAPWWAPALLHTQTHGMRGCGKDQAAAGLLP